MFQGNQFATVPDCTGFGLNALGIQPQHCTADEQMLILCLAAGEKCTSTEQGFRFNGHVIIHDQNMCDVTLLLHPVDFNHTTGKSASTADIFILYNVDIFTAQCWNIQGVGIVGNEHFQFILQE